VAELFALAGSSRTPRFVQVVEAVVAALKAGRLKKGDRLPSINEACRHSGLARGTVVKAYARLEELRLIDPVHGMGYFVRAEAIDLRLRTLVVFDTLNGYKERLYAGLVDGVAGRAELDVWFHHFKPALFRRILLESAGRYDRYVVMPFRCPEAREGLAAIAPERLLLLDVLGGAATRRRSWIVQNFDVELIRALATGLERLRRYRKFHLVFPPEKRHQPEIPGAFMEFGRRHGVDTSLLARLNEGDVETGAAYLVIEDDDLVNLVSWCQGTGQRLGRDVGIVSYNDTPLKRVVAGGITVVSTDFYAQGIRAAEHLLAPGPLPMHETRPTELTLRSSL
jgi:DNA-binding transcriptional regulator YhcF (GntR family)